jgi:hypothetical protein
MNTSGRALWFDRWSSLWPVAVLFSLCAGCMYAGAPTAQDQYEESLGKHDDLSMPGLRVTRYSTVMPPRGAPASIADNQVWISPVGVRMGNTGAVNLDLHVYGVEAERVALHINDRLRSDSAIGATVRLRRVIDDKVIPLSWRSQSRARILGVSGPWQGGYEVGASSYYGSRRERPPTQGSPELLLISLPLTTKEAPTNGRYELRLRVPEAGDVPSIDLRDVHILLDLDSLPTDVVIKPGVNSGSVRER